MQNATFYLHANNPLLKDESTLKARLSLSDTTAVNLSMNLDDIEVSFFINNLGIEATDEAIETFDKMVEDWREWNAARRTEEADDREATR